MQQAFTLQLTNKKANASTQPCIVVYQGAQGALSWCKTESFSQQVRALQAALHPLNVSGSFILTHFILYMRGNEHFLMPILHTYGPDSDHACWLITCADEWWTQLYNARLLYNLCRWGVEHTTMLCNLCRWEVNFSTNSFAMQLVEMRLKLHSWGVEQTTIIFIFYATCADEIKLVRIRGGTQYTSLLLCKLCQECMMTSSLLWWNNNCNHALL